MSTKKTSARTAVTRVLIFSLALGLIPAITASAAPSGSFAFLDSVKEFLGIQRAEVSVLKEQPKTPQLAQANESTGARLVTSDLAPEVSSDLFISEYIEGSSNNKAIEIYNGTGASVNLATGTYVVQVYANGSATPSSTTSLTGTVVNGDVFVIANTSSNGTILGQADQTSGNINFNGDDAVVLRKGGTSGTILDVFGQIGFDPGTEWGSGATSTLDHTLTRKNTVCVGDTNGADSFDPSVQWNGAAVDTATNLGSHSSLCSAATRLAITNISPASPTVGTGFSVTVQSQDGSNVATNVGSTTGITLSNTGGGSIGGTTSGSITAGTNQVVISGVTLSAASAGVTLTATRSSGDSLTAGTSAPFTVLPAVVPPTKLAITSISPSSPIAGSGFDVTVQSQDATSTAANVLATTGFTLSTNGVAGAIGGTTTGTITAGTNSVTVTGVTLPTPGSGVTLTATRSSGDILTAGTSATFTVVAVPTRFVITSISPVTPTAGTGFSVTVQAQDAGGNVANVSAATGFSLSTNGNAGAISGATTGSISSGSASLTLPGVILASPGTGVTITATRTSGDNLTAATSATFTVIAQAPTSLTYSTNPATYTYNTPITNNTPSNTGGAIVSYGVSPALPTGLSLDTTTGVISGTPTAATAAANYTVTGTNTGGSNTVDVNITVAKATQIITFDPLDDQTLGAAPITVSATGGASGNPVTFAASGGHCTSGGANGATIMLVSVGTCTVTASQAGNANYSAAANVVQEFEIVPTPVITVTGGPLNFPNTGIGSASVEMTYIVSGDYLTSPITVTSPSADFEVSLTSGSGFTSSLTVGTLRPANPGKGKGKGKVTPQSTSNLTIPTTTIYARFFPHVSGLQTGNITNTSNGAVTRNVAVSGTGVNNYTLTYIAGAHGSVAPSTPQTVASGGSGSAVTATADANYHFVNWSDSSTQNPRTDTNVTGNISVTANFAIDTYLLTINMPSNGLISSSPAGITCGADCTENFDYATVVTLSTEPDAGYRLSSWTGDCSGSGLCVVTMDAAKTVGATFVQNDVTFNTPGAQTLPAGTYHDILIDDPGAVVTGTGDIVVTGTFRVRKGAWGTSGSPTGYAVLSGGPGSAFVLETGGTLRITSPAGITASGATGAIQTATRTYDTGASYVYDGSTSQAVGDGLPATVGNLTISNTGPDGPSPAADHTVTGNNGQIVTGLLNIVDGVYESHSDYTDVNIAATGTLTLAGNTTVSGNWTNAGTLVHNNFTVTLDGGTGQTISGTTTFYGLTKAITTPAQTLNFTAGSTTNVAGPLTLTGTAGNLLSLRSTVAATQWNINATGSRNVDYADAQDSNATGSISAINATNSANAGNNTNWTFNTVVNYTIDVTQTANGTISPDDTVVTGGSNQTFYITPAVGYDIVSITVDGGSVPVAGSYTFTNVTADHTITATYALASCRTISIAASTSNTGVPVTVPVNTTDVTGGNVIAAQFKVTYDPAVITPVAGGPSAVVTAGTVLPGGTSITANTGTAGVIEVSLSGTTPFTGTGALVNLHFDVIGAPGASTALTLSNINPGPDFYYNGGTVCASVSSGSLSVVSTASTTVVTTSPVGTSVYGDNVTFTASVTPATTGGTVQFQVDGNDAGAPVPVVSGIATYSTTTLQVTGSAHNITGNYSGFSPYSASSGSTTITITARPVTVTAATDSKGYDGTTASAGVPTVTAGTLANGDVGVFTQTFDNRNVGAGKTLTPTGTVTDGNGGNNYAIAFTPVATGTITARAITVTAVTDSKGYDGTTSSASIPTVTSGSIVSPDAGVFTQTFATKHAGAGKTLNAAGSVSDGNLGNNYAITFAANTTGVITARAITVTATTDTKGYDGNTSSAALPTITSGILASGDSAVFSQVFDTRDVGSGKMLTPSGTITDGNGGNNYAVTYTPVSTGVITARAITVTAATDTKGYDGTTSSTGTPTITSGSLISPDSATLSQAFDTKNVGTGKTLTALAVINDGNGGANYAVTYVADTTGVITARAITVTASTDSREYNGTTSSSATPVTGPGTIAAGDTAAFTQSFATKHVGTGKTLTASGSVSDGNAGLNYAVTFVANTTGVITAKAITVTAVTDSREYNGTTASSGSPTIAPALVGGDTSGFTQSYDNKNVGTGKTLTAAGTVNDGFGGNNYSVSFVSVSTGVITARAITVTAATDSRVYNGTTSSAAAPTITTGSLATGDSAVFSQTFDTRHVGTGKTLTPAGTITDGNGGNNYAVTYTAVLTGTITAKPITVTAVTETKVYDGTTASSVSPNISPALVGGDTSGFTQTFDNKNVGTGKTLTAAGAAIDGNGGNNYAVTLAAVSTGVITARAITVTAATDTRGYDGTTASSGSPTIVPALVGGDTSGFTQSFDNRNVGTGKTLTAAGAAIDGNSGNNYAVTFVANTTGVITARAITVTAATDTKVYDGTTVSAGVPTITSGSLASGDSAVFSQTFDTRHVGTGKTLTPAGTITDGNGGNNYAVTYATNSTGVITTSAATWTTNPASKTFGDADPVPLTTGSGSGFLVVDGVSATYSRVAGEAASGPTYHITATLTAATGDLADYSITNTGAEFTINARTLTGTVTYENAAPGTVPIKQTTLTSTGSAPLPAPVQTDLNGNYSLTGFGTTSYTITPTRAPYATNQFNGIFANDASLIAQHVVHLITLNAAQQKAADVSGIGAITSFDASLVAQYIVGIPNALNKTGNWTFTPASTSLIVTPGSVRDFTGILMGDVSGDWNPALARPAQVMGKDAVSSVRAVVPNVTAAPGTAISVPFRIENLEGAGVKAYQFDIEYNPAVVAPASIAATVNGTLSEGLSVVSNAPAPGLLKVVVFGAFPVNGDGVYVNLQFSAIGGAGSSTPLSIREFRLDDGQTPVFTIDGSLTLASATNENSIRGRLLTPFGAGVSNATVILTGTTINTRVHVISGGMGYFEFGGLVTGETYTVSVRSKRFTFSPRTVSVTQNVTNLDMIAEQ